MSVSETTIPADLSRSGIHSFWGFRRTVPVRLRPFLNKTAFKKSFGLADLNAIKPAYYQFAKDVEELLQAAEAALAAGSTEPLEVPALAPEVGPIGKRRVEAILSGERTYRAEATRPCRQVSHIKTHTSITAARNAFGS